MDIGLKSNSCIVLSPQPKRPVFTIADRDFLDLPRCQSCEIENNDLNLELSSILSYSPASDLSSLFSQFSPDSRPKTNPIIFDEKFVQLEYSLSTSEDSGSESDKLLESI